MAKITRSQTTKGEELASKASVKLDEILVQSKNVLETLLGNVGTNYSLAFQINGLRNRLEDLIFNIQKSSLTIDQVGEYYADNYCDFSWPEMKPAFLLFRVALNDLADTISSNATAIRHSMDSLGNRVYDQPLSAAKDSALITKINACLAEFG